MRLHVPGKIYMEKKNNAYHCKSSIYSPGLILRQLINRQMCENVFFSIEYWHSGSRREP